MGRAILFEVLDRPATTGVLTTCIAIWLHIKQKNLGYQDVGMSYESVVQRHQYWRIIVSQLSHVELLHLLFNVSAVWSMDDTEKPAMGGSLAYIKISFLLLLLSGLICLAVYHVLIKYFRQEMYLRVTAVGYSCVAFGWMTLLALQQGKGSRFSLFGMAHLPMAMAPFFSLLITSLLIPNASFIGHLSGIIAGALLWLGLLKWFTTYWTACLLVWVAMGVLYGLVREGVIGPPYIRVHWYEEDIEIGTAGHVPADIQSIPVRS